MPAQFSNVMLSSEWSHDIQKLHKRSLDKYEKTAINSEEIK